MARVRKWKGLGSGYLPHQPPQRVALCALRQLADLVHVRPPLALCLYHAPLPLLDGARLLVQVRPHLRREKAEAGVRERRGEKEGEEEGDGDGDGERERGREGERERWREAERGGEREGQSAHAKACSSGGL